MTDCRATAVTRPGAVRCRWWVWRPAQTGLIAAACVVVCSGLPGGAAAQGSPRTPDPPPPAAAAPPAQTIVIEARAADEAERRRQSVVGGVVVGRDELDRHGDISLLDVLQRLPGVSLDGETPQLRGMGAGYTLILLNGEPAPPGFSLDSLAPGDIERIELIKGPSAEHGGVAGSINVILRQAPRVRQREWRAALGYRAVAPQGSTSLSWGDRIGDLGFHLPLSAFSWANGQTVLGEQQSRPGPAPGGTQGESIHRQSRSVDQWQGAGLRFAPRLDHKLDAQHSLQWQGLAQRNHNRSSQQRSTTVLAGPPVQTTLADAHTRGHWQIVRGQLQWLRTEPGGQRLELKAAGQQTRGASAHVWSGRGADGVPTVQRDTLTSHREDQRTLGLRWRLPWESGGGGEPGTPGGPGLEDGVAHTLQLGWDIEHRRRDELRRLFEDRGNGAQELLQGSLGQPLHTQTQRHTAFVQDEWAYDERLSLSLGLRLEQWQLRTAGAGEVVHRAHRRWLPVLHARRTLDAAGRDVFRASLAHSLRAPDPALLLPRYQLNGAHPRDEPNTPLAADSAGNPLLTPERASALELALERSLPGGGVLSAGLFHRRIEGLIRRRIALQDVPEASVQRWVSRPANIGAAHSTGLELEVKGSAPQLLGAWGEMPPGLRLRAALSVYRSGVEQLDDPDARLDGQPPWSLKLGLDHSLAGGRWSGGASLDLTPGFSTQQSDQQRIWRGAVQRLDAYLALRIDRQTQFRLALVNLGAPDALSRSTVSDAQGPGAPAAASVASATRRSTHAQLTGSLRMGF